MPRQPLRTVRVPDVLWTDAQAKAAEDGVSVSRVIQAGLRFYAYGEPFTLEPDDPASRN